MKKTERNQKAGLTVVRRKLKVAGHEWCYQLRVRALNSALRTAATAKISASDVVSLMKIRRSLVEASGRKRQFVWRDPPHWKLPPVTQPDVAA